MTIEELLSEQSKKLKSIQTKMCCLITAIENVGIEGLDGGGTVTSIATGVGLTGGPITTTGTISFTTALQPMATLTGNASKFLRVNAGETAVEYAIVAGTGTVTNTGGNLTANAVVLGAGGTDTKVVTGIITDGTSKLTLGVAGASVGAILFKNATSGTITLQPQTGALGTVTLTMPAVTDTLVAKDTVDVLTNKTLTSANITTKLLPTTDDGAPLGDTTHNFSDLFLATGAVINYANGNTVLTHSSGILTLGTGEMRITTPGTNSTSVVTIGAAQILTSKVLTSATITTGLTPTTNDGAALGSTALQFSDLFLASGGVLNYANGNVVLTHTSGILTLGTGTLKITTPTNTTTSVVTVDGTQTLSNKRITERVQSVSSSATVTPNADNDDMVKITAQAVGLTIANATGTPTEGQGLVIRIKDNGSGQTITVGPMYREVGVIIPGSTVANKTLYLGFIYNATDSKFDCIGVSQEV